MASIVVLVESSVRPQVRDFAEVRVSLLGVFAGSADFERASRIFTPQSRHATLSAYLSPRCAAVNLARRRVGLTAAWPHGRFRVIA
jgi:hypothetical protein